MGLISGIAFIQSLKSQPLKAKALGLSFDESVEKRGRGRPKMFTPKVERGLVALIDREKRGIDRRSIEADPRYGERCADTKHCARSCGASTATA